MKPNRTNIESALDRGVLRCKAPNGNLWKVRRNGKTVIKGTSYRIPVTIGFRNYANITAQSLGQYSIVES